MLLPNYELLERIAEGELSVVYKACHRQEPRRLLALKVLKAVSVSGHRREQFRQRIEHLRIVDAPLAAVPLAFGGKDGGFFVVREYFEGLPLDDLRAGAPLPLADFFTIACRLAETLDRVHAAGIVHGGIKPHNVLVDPRTLDLRLIDFVSIVDIRDVSHFIYNRSFVRETLSYTSPEQTGRINHRVGFPSDLYSLGVVLYELLTGRLPFTSDDPLELIHSHLAEEAPRADELRADVPAALGRVVARLLVKEPEKRYRSGRGLLADLQRCRDEYAATGAVREFPLESAVSTRRVTFISRMVGRDREAGIILEEYEQAARGGFRALLISGLSGIGKTRLIQELQRPIVKHRGYFTSGKFDVYRKNIPYSSLIQALKNLIRTFLTESDERAGRWKRRILAAVGDSGRVLIDVIPELEALIGPQPAVRPLPPVEALNRFHDLFDRFLGCLASEENPLTLFIDDLQWCDSASFDFLANLFANCADHPHLLLLGAYRHNEVEAGHPLSRLIRTAVDGGRPLREIRLGPLQPADCHEMVSYILDSPLSQTRELSDFISTLSEGNPLFVSESLSYLHHEQLLSLDAERHWRWDLERIRRTRMPGSVVALFSSKLRKLPPGLVGLLEICACLGNTFPPDELAAIAGLTLLETFETLKPALGQGLLIENRNRLQFIHDRVQEAALSAIPPRKRRGIHWRIGSHLLAAVPEGADPAGREDLFTIVSHLNLGREERPDRETAYRLSDLNYQAGNKALDSLATEAANEFYRQSRELLPEDCWRDDRYERTFRIYQKAAKTELMCGAYGNSERLLAELLEHAETELDKAECLAEQTTSLSSIGSFAAAIETANRGLAYFGKAIPDSPEEADRRRGELMAEIDALGLDVWETIRRMPFTSDRRSKIELAFYSELIPDLYMSGLVPQLYLAAAQSTRHCLSGGMDESVIYSFSIMGLQLGEREEFERAFRYEDLARELSAEYPNTFGATRGMNGIVWCNMHSRSHPRQIADYCLKSIQCGRNCGDLYNAGLSYGPLMWNQQVQGADLSAVEDSARECLQFSNRYHLAFSVGLAEAMQAGWIEPMKREGRTAPMEEKLERWERDNHVASAGSYFVLRAMAHYYLGEHGQARAFLEGARKYLSGLTDNVLKRQWHVFVALNALKLYEAGEGAADAAELRRQVEPFIRKVELWAGLGPLLKPYAAFLRAELERVTGNPREARQLLLEAIGCAHDQEYTFLEGHLNECLGGLLREAGLGSAGLFLREAARLYRRCRAERKELALGERHPEAFEEERAARQPPPGEPLPPPTLPNLDVEYLMKSSSAISAEIALEAVLKKVMNVVLECSGAQYGCLLIEEDGVPVIRAESRVTGKQAARILRQRLEESGEACGPIIRYVQRTGERVILSDAAQEGAFKDNPEVQGRQLRSVLCLPVIRQSRRIGILYLENRLSDAVFTPQKTQMTELLTSQAAISLENALLFQRQQEAEQALRDRESELRLIMDAVPALIAYIDSGHRYLRINRTYERWLGITDEQARGRPVREVLGEDNWQIVRPYQEQALRGERASFQGRMSLGGGEPRWVEAAYVPDHDESGRVRGFVAHTVDIGGVKQAEEQVRRSLREKEALLKEIHHRVKNNLQIIHSMLNLQLPAIRDEQDSALFKESQNRIYSMALIHEKLYQSESLVMIDLAEYIRSLTANLLDSYGVGERAVHLEVSVERVTLGIDTVIPCALIINELVSNSLKHAFPPSRPDGRRGEIRVALRPLPDGLFLLTVGDNGVGLPAGFELQGCRSLGLKLVDVLARQLRGTIRVESDGGTEFSITFQPVKVKEGS